MRVAWLFMTVIVVSIVAMATPPSAIAQEIPYGVKDKEKLDTILRDANTHFASYGHDTRWLAAAGVASHQLATMMVRGASDEAVMYLKKATELDSDNAEILAYLGSAYAMAGRDSSFLVSKISNVNRGLAALDKAVKKDPQNLNVRFIRGSVSYNLPAMFSRKKTAESDYLFFVNAAETGVHVDADRLAEAYYKLGSIAEANNQKDTARAFHMQAQNASPGSEWAQQASRAMQ